MSPRYTHCKAQGGLSHPDSLTLFFKCHCLLHTHLTHHWLRRQIKIFDIKQMSFRSKARWGEEVKGKNSEYTHSLSSVGSASVSETAKVSN